MTLLITSAPVFGRDESVGPASARVQVATDAPAGVSPDWWRAAQAELARMEYEISAPSALPNGARQQFHAPNRAQNFRTVFEPDGLRILPRTSHASEAPAWEWGLEFLAWGRTNESTLSGGAQLTARGNRIEYQRDGLVEWYVNDARGLEQGFTLACDPTPARVGAFVEVRMAVTGTVQGRMRSSGNAIDFLTAEGALAVRLAELVAKDADGRTLPAWFELELAGGDAPSAQILSIRVDDRGAAYPITIDPLATSPAWTVEGDQTGALLGISVATAGDVNGDGYSDVIVGASYYDVGAATEAGRALVYHGSAAGLSVIPSRTIDGTQASAHFGECVATAGDVNGDDYSDVAVGAQYHDNGQSNEGRAFVYHGSASGVSATPAWTAEGNQADAWFGRSVAAAGDVDGDGYGDLVVGASGYDNGSLDEGRAFLYRGSASGLATTAAWTAESNQAGASFGYSVATAGDVNGDAYSDVIVGAGWYTNGESSEGRALVYHGSASGLSAIASWAVEGNQIGALFGVCVATAGDVDGDGYADVIVGASGFDSGEINEGRAFVYPGSATGLSTTPIWTGESNQQDASFGHEVASGGDVNGDGYADVIVAAHLYDSGQTDEGMVFLYYGSATGLSGVWSGEGNQAFCRFGSGLATAGDVNGDGFSDVIVGAVGYANDLSNEGGAFVYHGSAAGLRTLPSWSEPGDQAAAFYGGSVAAAGDVDGDGFGDVIVGASLYSNPESDEGRVFVYHGSASGLSTTPSWTAEGNQVGAQFGYSVSTAGDVDGDGYADVAIGALGYDAPQVDEGRVFVYHGSASGLSATPNWTAESDVASAFFGCSVACAGDVDGDGYSDLVVGADNYDGGQSNEGAAFVYHGSSSGLAAAPNWSVEGGAVGEGLGHCVAAAGDVDGDGFSDLVVGVPLHDGGQTNEGRALLFRGSPAGLSTAAAWSFESNQTSAVLGWSVASAGDVNGDGFSDVLVGAPRYDGVAADTGRVDLFLGSIEGLSPTPDRSIHSGQAGGQFGNSVASAGDVDGDGYSDVVLGAPLYDDGQVDEGSAWVYHGSAAGLVTVPSWAGGSDQVDARFGDCVAPAGDVDGDGYGDLVVGATNYDTPLPGGVNAGAAFVYLGNEGRGRMALPQQKRLGGSIIAPLGRSDSETTFNVSAFLYPFYGRTRAAIETEVAQRTALFDGLDTTVSVDASAFYWLPISVTVFPGLTPGTPYHWRVRARFDPARTPFQQHGPWIHMPTNGWNEADLRTAGNAPPWAFCFGDGTDGDCPCGNEGSAGRGCANSAFPAGALLAGSGVASVAADTVVLSATGLTGTSCVFFQGSARQEPAVIDDGLGCVIGTVIRLGTKSVTSNASSFPQAGDASISVRGAIPAVGALRYYQCFYRNAAAAFCPPATSNRTNGVAVHWIP